MKSITRSLVTRPAHILPNGIPIKPHCLLVVGNSYYVIRKLTLLPSLQITVTGPAQFPANERVGLFWGLAVDSGFGFWRGVASRFGFGVGVVCGISEIGAGSRCAENSSIDATARNRMFALTLGFNQKAHCNQRLNHTWSFDPTSRYFTERPGRF